MTTNNNGVEIEWYDLANLIFGDLVTDEDALQKLAEDLEQLRSNVQGTILPVVTDASDARLVYAQLAYKIQVMENELQQFTIGTRHKNTPKPRTSYAPSSRKDILIAISEQLIRFETLKAQIEIYTNRLEDSDLVAQINTRLADIFGN